MTREEFEAEVARLELLARESPRVYRRRVAMLAFLGYGSVYAMAGACLLLGIALLWLLSRGGASSAIGAVAIALLGLPMAGTLLILVESVRVRMDPVHGLRLPRGAAPTLHEAVNALRVGIGSPRVHEIVLVADATAAMVQRPRLGLFGWYRNTLVVGLALMQGMSVPQFSAVIAHEMAHLSGGHGRLGAWIYRTCRTWSGLMSSFQGRGVKAGLVRNFLAWYVPRLNACTFALRREDEYEADRVAAKVVGAPAAGQALIITHLLQGFLADHFWPGVQKMAGDVDHAPPGMFAMMGRVLPGVASAKDAYKWLRRGLMLETDLSDTHPCLAERLAALGQLDTSQSVLEAAWRSEPPPPPSLTAAQQYLGRSLEQISTELEAIWRYEVHIAWREAYARAHDGRRRLAALNKKAEYGRLNDEESVDQCILAEQFLGVQHAIPLAERLVSRFPSAPAPRFQLGRMKLEAGDSAGIALIDEAIAREPDWAYEGCELIYEHLRATGRHADAKAYIRRAEQAYQAQRRTARNLDGINDSDAFEPHGLTGDLVSYLRERLQEIRDLEAAYLVRKASARPSDPPILVLAVQPKKLSTIQRLYHESIEQLLAQKIRQFAHALLLVRLDRCPRSVPDKIRRVTGARILPLKHAPASRR